MCEPNNYPSFSPHSGLMNSCSSWFLCFTQVLPVQISVRQLPPSFQDLPPQDAACARWGCGQAAGGQRRSGSARAALAAPGCRCSFRHQMAADARRKGAQPSPRASPASLEEQTSHRPVTWTEGTARKQGSPGSSPCLRAREKELLRSGSACSHPGLQARGCLWGWFVLQTQICC